MFLAASPHVDRPPEQDPFLDMLFRPEVGGAIFAAVIAVLVIALLIRRRYRDADDYGEEPVLPDE